MKDQVVSAPRILVSRPDHLGDLLLTLPAIATLRAQLPAARISCMVPEELLPIVDRMVDVDEAISLPAELRMDASPGAAALSAHAGALRDRFDLALLPRPRDPWSGSLVAAASVPLRVGHADAATRPFLTHAVPEHRSRHVAAEAVVLAKHAARLLGAESAQGPDPDPPWLELPAEDRAAAAEAVEEIGSSAPVIVHPTAGWALKSWPASRWARLVAGLCDRLAAPVLVVGRGSEAALLDEIARAAGPGACAIHHLSIGPLAALHERARVVVGMDSGALHLAAAVGAPVVGLYGPFGADRVAPLGPPNRVRTISRSLPCSPCGTLEAPPCGASHDPPCLLAVSVEDVVRSVVELDGMSDSVEHAWLPSDSSIGALGT